MTFKQCRQNVGNVVDRFSMYIIGWALVSEDSNHSNFVISLYLTAYRIFLS